MTDIISAHQIVGNGVRAIYTTCTHLYGVFESDAGPEPLSACPAVPWPPGVLAASRWEVGTWAPTAPGVHAAACWPAAASLRPAVLPPARLGRGRRPALRLASVGPEPLGQRARAAGRQRPACGGLAGGGGLGARAAPGGESREGASGQDRRGIGLG